jgi:hypothetical protein
MFNLELLMFHCVVWIGYSFLTYFNLELLIFHCVVWIRRNTLFTRHNGTPTVISWASAKKEYPIHTTQWNINSSKLNICQEGIPNPHYTMEHQWCGYGIPSWQMFNLLLLMFHCVVWIGYSFFTDFQLRTIDVPLCSVDCEHLSRRNTLCTPHNGTSTVLSWTSVKKEYPIHTTQWNINSSKLNICQEEIPNPHHTMEHQQL